MCSLLHPILLLGLSWIPVGILELWRWSWEVHGEMGPGQCLQCVVVVVSVQERRGQAAALLGKAVTSELCPMSLFPSWLGQWKMSPSPASVTCLAPLILPHCPCLCFPGGQAVMETPLLFQGIKPAQELADFSKLQRNSANCITG